jgi:hypothetical protein
MRKSALLPPGDLKEILAAIREPPAGGVLYFLLVPVGGRRLWEAWVEWPPLPGDRRRWLEEEAGPAWKVGGWPVGAFAAAWWGRDHPGLRMSFDLRRESGAIKHPEALPLDFLPAAEAVAGVPRLVRGWLRVGYLFRDLHQAAQLSASLGVDAGHFTRCEWCEAVDFRPTRARVLCRECAALKRGRVDEKKLAAWQRLLARWRKRGTNTARRRRQALQDLHSLPLAEWVQKYLEADRRRAGRPPKVELL